MSLLRECRLFLCIVAVFPTLKISDETKLFLHVMNTALLFFFFEEFK